MSSDITDDATTKTEVEPRITVSEVAGQFYRKRKGRGLTLEQASEQTGVSAATLSRLERLRERDSNDRVAFTPDTRTLSAVIRWLDIALSSVIALEGMESRQEREVESVPDIVEAHLRADRNLDDQSALALAQMFRVAYNQFSRLRQGDESHSGKDPSVTRAREE